MKYLILLICFLPFGSLMAQGDGMFEHNYIDIVGKAELEIIPDEIYLNIDINETDNKGQVSVEELEKKMIEALKATGVNFDNDFSVNDIASNFKAYWLKSPDIVSSKSYQLIVHDAEIASNVFQELEKLGISNISISKVDHSNIEKYRSEVKTLAIMAAKAKAINLTKAIGQTIGRAIYIKEYEPVIYPKNYSNIMMVRGSAQMNGSAEIMPEIQFKKIKLEYSVQVYFELK